MAGFGQQPQQDVQQTTHIIEILDRMGLQRDVPITGMQAGQMFALLCESFQTALTGQQARVEQMALNLQAEHAGVVNKMREDVDNSLKHNAQVAGEQIAQLKAGQFFGESTLLKDAPANATVKTLAAPVTCYVCSRESFTAILGPLQALT